MSKYMIKAFIVSVVFIMTFVFLIYYDFMLFLIASALLSVMFWSIRPSKSQNETQNVGDGANDADDGDNVISES